MGENRVPEFMIINPYTLPTQSSRSPSNALPETTFPQRESTFKAEFKWSNGQTKMLLDLYKKYRNKVGTLQLKNQKQLWKVIAAELKTEIPEISEENCHNRWRVLERNYKKYVDNQNATGRGRKYFEYIEEMENIFGGKKSVHPVLVLSSDQTHQLETDNDDAKNTDENINNQQQSAPNVLRKPKISRKKKNSVELMREERKAYYEERLEIEREKLQELKRRNDLIAERNVILKESNDRCCNNKF